MTIDGPLRARWHQIAHAIVGPHGLWKASINWNTVSVRDFIKNGITLFPIPEYKLFENRIISIDCLLW